MRQINPAEESDLHIAVITLWGSSLLAGMLSIPRLCSPAVPAPWKPRENAGFGIVGQQLSNLISGRQAARISQAVHLHPYFRGAGHLSAMLMI
jgi:hypothetical protein